MKNNVLFNGIAGYKKEIADLKEIAVLFNMITAGEDVSLPKGLLIAGDSGMGKTMMAWALANESGVNVLELEIEDNISGVCEIKESFEKAKSSAPCVIIVDGIDKKFGDEKNKNGQGRIAELRNAFIKEMNSIEDDCKVLVVGTANNIKTLESSFVRAGRFDRCIKLNIPNMEERLEILGKYVGKKKIEDRKVLIRIAKSTFGCSCAEIKSIIGEASIYAVDNGGVITKEHLLKGIDRIKFKTLPNSLEMSEEQKRIIATHEAGHLVVALHVMPEYVRAVSISSRDDVGGYLSIGNENEKLLRLSVLENLVSVLFGGMIAEKIILNDSFSGNAQDVASAKTIVHDLLLVHHYYGLSFCGGEDDACLFSKQISEEGMKRNEQMQFKILNNQYDSAECLLDKHADLLNVYIEKLMENIALEKEEIEEIFESYKNDNFIKVA